MLMPCSNLAERTVKSFCRIARFSFQLATGISRPNLSKWDLSDLIRRFGKFGAELHNLARGQDERSVQPHHERKSISVERTFGDFTTGLETASGKVSLLYEELYS
jgi:DNA polymerase-4